MKQDRSYILYADDDPDDLEIIGDTVQRLTPLIDVVTRENGKKAFEFLELLTSGDRLPSLVVLDLNMPDWDGFKTLEELKKHPVYQKIPVVIFTNSDHPQHRSLSVSNGAAGFQTKPDSNQELKKICEWFAGYTSLPATFK